MCKHPRVASGSGQRLQSSSSCFEGLQPVASGLRQLRTVSCSFNQLHTAVCTATSGCAQWREAASSCKLLQA
eukprot:15456863-Alexandrium_andersonii.AAC.1